MGGWNIYFGLLNFVILVIGLYLVGKKIVLKKYTDHRGKIESELKRSQEAAVKAQDLESKIEQLGIDGEKECRDIMTDAELQAKENSAAAERAYEQTLARMDQDKEREYERLRSQMRRELNREAAASLAGAAAERIRSGDKSDALKALEAGFAERFSRVFKLSPSEQARIKNEGQVWAKLTVAEPMPLENIVCLDKAIGDGLHGMGVAVEGANVHISSCVDPGIIGGARLQIGDTVFDGTLLSALERAKETLGGIEKTDGGYVEGLKDALAGFDGAIDVFQAGRVISASDGICRVAGLPDAMSGEMLRFEGGLTGMVMDLEKDNIGVVLLGDFNDIHEGDQVRCTGHIIEVPVGEELIGRVVDALGRPVDGKGAIHTGHTRAIESPAPGVIERRPVSVPMQTGIKAIDALIPIGRGQRELIIGDRQTGKTAIALDAIINQRGKDIICIYVAIGQKESTVAGVVEKLRAHGAMDYTTVVCASASEPAPMLYIAPYAGAAMGEYFMYNGRDVLIVYDDLSKQAVAYREISLLLHRPPGREAYPGDVFYLHSRLLERAARLSEEAGGGSLTALPIIKTQAGDISAYIPTNDISITDGQIFLETELFNSGVRPAVNVGLSVSRVGGAAQLGAVKQVAGRLRMELAQYRELAAFSQFGFDLDKATRDTLDKGDRMTELLKQDQYAPMAAADQVVSIFAVSEGYAADVAVKDIPRFEKELLSYVGAHYPELSVIVDSGKKLNAEQLETLRSVIAEFKKIFT